MPRVAKRLQVKVPQVEAWESGARQPTMRQIKLLAGLYQRPLSLFFLPESPKVVPLAAEDGRLADVVPGQGSEELRLAIRHMLARRENALNLMEELREEITEFRDADMFHGWPPPVASSTASRTGRHHGASTWVRTAASSHPCTRRRARA